MPSQAGAKLLNIVCELKMNHHSKEGHWPNAQNATIIGLVFGAIFAYTWRFFMLMCAYCG
jgi:hypothetical protein